MKIIELDNKSKYLQKYKEIYFEAFPKEELVPFWFIQNSSKKGRSKMVALIENDNLVGMSWIIKNKDLTYLFFLAISKEDRDKGYGSIFLDLIRKKYNKDRLILCIEELDQKAVNYKQRLSRKSFYERNGYKEANVRVIEKGGTYDFLVNGNNFTTDEYIDLIKKVSGAILYIYIKRILLVDLFYMKGNKK